MIPQKLAAIEVSIVSFGGIPNARIGETLEGFDERTNFYDNIEEENEDVVIDNIKQETNESNDTFISEEEKDLNKQTSNQIDNSKNKEADKMSEKEISEFQQKIEKLELEKKALIEERDSYKTKVAEYDAKEEARLATEKEVLIEEIGKHTEITDEKVTMYKTWDVSALEELLKVAKESIKPIPSEGDEPMPKAVVSTQGEQAKEDPTEKRVKSMLEKVL
jgi:hypothetical protein